MKGQEKINKVQVTKEVVTVHFEIPLKRIKYNKPLEEEHKKQWDRFKNFKQSHKKRITEICDVEQDILVGDCPKEEFEDFKKEVEELLESVPDIFED